MPLRDGTEGRKSRVAAVVFTDENEPETMFNADIKHALLTSLCRAKAAVTQAFAEAVDAATEEAVESCCRLDALTPIPKGAAALAPA